MEILLAAPTSEEWTLVLLLALFRYCVIYEKEKTLPTKIIKDMFWAILI